MYTDWPKQGKLPWVDPGPWRWKFRRLKERWVNKRGSLDHLPVNNKHLKDNLTLWEVVIDICLDLFIFGFGLYTINDYLYNRAISQG